MPLEMGLSITAKLLEFLLAFGCHTFSLERPWRTAYWLAIRFWLFITMLSLS